MRVTYLLMITRQSSCRYPQQHRAQLDKQMTNEEQMMVPATPATLAEYRGKHPRVFTVYSLHTRPVHMFTGGYTTSFGRARGGERTANNPVIGLMVYQLHTPTLVLAQYRQTRGTGGGFTEG